MLGGGEKVMKGEDRFVVGGCLKRRLDFEVAAVVAATAYWTWKPREGGIFLVAYAGIK